MATMAGFGTIPGKVGAGTIPGRVYRPPKPVPPPIGRVVPPPGPPVYRPSGGIPTMPKPIASMKKGGKAAKTGPYKLHKGETVMPKKSALGEGGRFAALKASIEERNKKGPKKPAVAAKRPGGGKVDDPGALSAFIGRKNYGGAKMAAMSAAGRKG